MIKSTNKMHKTKQKGEQCSNKSKQGTACGKNLHKEIVHLWREC